LLQTAFRAPWIDCTLAASLIARSYHHSYEDDDGEHIGWGELSELLVDEATGAHRIRVVSSRWPDQQAACRAQGMRSQC
jgi:hypothetical protein